MNFVALFLLLASLSQTVSTDTDRGAGLDPNGTSVRSSSLVNTDKGLGVDPNG